jgi:uncharacterized membrane protein
MTLLIAGLVIFLGLHSARVFAEGWRKGRINAWGEGGWKGAYSVLSLIGFVMIIYGYSASRQAPIDLWVPPLWTRHVTALLTLPMFVMLVAAYVPGTHIKAALKHPMTLSVKLWALAHLVSNGRLGDVLLFGGFLAWAVLVFIAARKRDRAQGVTYTATSWTKDVIAVVVGLIAWVVFALYLHAKLIGVSPLG